MWNITYNTNQNNNNNKDMKSHKEVALEVCFCCDTINLWKLLIFINYLNLISLYSAPWIMHSVLGPSLQDRHFGARMCPKMGTKLAKGLEHKSWGAAEEAGGFQPGEKDAQKDLAVSTASWKEAVATWGSVSSQK